MRLVIIIVFVGLLSFNSQAQDQHYWSQMGGITAGLLGGSAIAGLKDNSSLYYNAAAMSYVDNPSISIGANTFRLRFVNVDNAFGEGIDQFHTQFVVNPDLIGGLLFSKKNDELRFGYAIATRFLHENNIHKQVIHPTSDGGNYVGDVDIQDRAQETWVNSANSYRMSDHFSLGYTIIVAIRSQWYNSYLGSKLVPLDENDVVKRFDSRLNYNYWNVKGLLRLSMAVDYPKFRMGMNVTLPSLNLFGQASVKREISVVNNISEINNYPADVVITGNAEKIGTKHKYPFSAAFGMSYELNNSDWIHFSTEFFLPISKYKVFKSNSEPVAHPRTSFDSISATYGYDEGFLTLYEQAKFVMNFSVGYENYITENWGVLAGFRTDFSYNTGDPYDLVALQPYASNWDIYYLSAGVWGVWRNQKITTGLEFGFSPPTSTRQLANFDDINSPNYPLLGEPKNTEANQLIMRLYLGIEINFRSKLEKKNQDLN